MSSSVTSCKGMRLPTLPAAPMSPPVPTLTKRQLPRGYRAMSEPSIKLAAFCGSLRKASFNRLALAAFTERLPAGVTLSTIEIGDWPLYDADVQAKGFPDKVQAAHKAMLEADGIVFATPEYNYSISGVLKNAIDC